MAFRTTSLARKISSVVGSAARLPARAASMSTSAATRQLFGAFATDSEDHVSSEFLLGFLERNGLLRDDLRLGQMMRKLDSLGAADTDRALHWQEFADATHTCSTLLYNAATGSLRVPDFGSLRAVVERVYEDVKPNSGGENAQYIPQLAQVDPDQFSISVTTVDGQHFSIGDADTQFCIQSCSKPLSYLIALSEFGEEYVHASVGTEPSGRAFNEMALKSVPVPGDPSHAIPHNPMINAGAIMSVSMVYPELSRQQRLEAVLQFWHKLSAGGGAARSDPVGYDDATYRSESSTADRNWCLGYMMKECNAWPPCCTSLEDTLELYFQICSILNTGRGMSTMAATLANGGVNPVSGVRVVAPEHIRCALPLMLTSGMYDYSGQWAYDVGVPAKSGVGGCVFLVIPNVCGIAIWSPRLDANGNSVRGVAAATELVRHLAIHNFEVFSGLSRKKIDLTMRKNAALCAEIGDVLFAAAQGDVRALISAINAGTDVFAGDYDNRTSLHLAAAEGHDEALQLLVDNIPSGDFSRDKADVLASTDRWGGTPLDDAIAGGHTACIEVLRLAGVTSTLDTAATDTPTGAKLDASKGSDDALERTVISAIDTTNGAPRILFAAADNDIDELVKLAATGADLLTGDYDQRTACHLAASNGHLAALKYILVQAGSRAAQAIQAQDRFGNSPLDDAWRNGHTACYEFLSQRLACEQVS